MVNAALSYIGPVSGCFQLVLFTRASRTVERAVRDDLIDQSMHGEPLEIAFLVSSHNIDKI